MASKQRERAGDPSPARSDSEPKSSPGEESKTMAATETQTSLAQRTGPLEGITVVGEAVRRLTPEHAEFLIEVTSSGSNAAQVLRESHNKTHQVSQALAPVGVQGADVHSISMNV